MPWPPGAAPCDVSRPIGSPLTCGSVAYFSIQRAPASHVLPLRPPPPERRCQRDRAAAAPTAAAPPPRGAARRRGRGASGAPLSCLPAGLREMCARWRPQQAQVAAFRTPPAPHEGGMCRQGRLRGARAVACGARARQTAAGLCHLRFSLGRASPLVLCALGALRARGRASWAWLGRMGGVLCSDPLVTRLAARSSPGCCGGVEQRARAGGAPDCGGGFVGKARRGRAGGRLLRGGGRCDAR